MSITDKNLERLARLRPIDDVFMRCLLIDDMGLVQGMLRTIVGIEDLTLIRMETQRDLKRLVGARSIELDVWGVDSNGTEYDMEVQCGSSPNPKRLRYHSACMDVEALDSGADFDNLPEQWVVFIMEKDPFGKGAGTYLFENACREQDILLGDGAHMLYANGSYRGDDELGSLMHDFCESDPNKIRNQRLADRVRYLKSTDEGVRTMGSVFDEIRAEAVEQGAEKKLLEDVRNLVAELDLLPERALEVLHVPTEDRPRILSML